MICAAALVLLTAGSAFSQYNVLKVDALGYIRDRVYLGYERTFFKKASVGLAYENNTYTQDELSGGGEYMMRTQGVIPEFRYYPFHKRRAAPLGFFAGAAFRYAKVSETYTPNNTELKGDLINYGLISGYKFRYRSFITEFLLGYGSGTLNDEFLAADRRAFRDYSDQDSIDELLRNLRMEISLGFVFPKINTKTSGRY